MLILQVNKDISLKLRDQSHARETFELIQKNRVHLREWLGWVDKVKTVKDSLNNIAMNEEEWELQTHLHLGIYQRDVMVGMISLHDIHNMSYHACIGYWIDEEHEGRGIITASVNTLLSYGFDIMKLNRIEIRAGIYNHKSRAIPERLGFGYEGLARQWEFLYDHYIDMAVYSLLKSEFKHK